MAADVDARCLRAQIECLRQDLLEAVEAKRGNLTSEEVLARSRRLDEAITRFYLGRPALTQACEACLGSGRRGTKEHQGVLKASQTLEAAEASEAAGASGAPEAQRLRGLAGY
ncbi:MAG: aspartyl-phosphate phosphatase Spo0E family protein [Firmicutes bacterium]|nr:aspartyl-phosphate phosphatase Spo0E family protein [Bacillota bacterium]MDH7496726.1 aspartyl-phosphate phosphatase Spo0E family protein [Bacillota bacterium]